MKRTVNVAAVCPIPVGHRVDVRIFEVERGVFRKSWEAMDDEPLIVDLDTGVTYAPAWCYREINMYVSGKVLDDLPMRVRSDLREAERFRATVTACRVVFIGSGDTRYPQTTLVLGEAEDE
ncbi:MAG: hypothetical protein AB7S26_37955 [Sandaracinaceae bacterium]